MAQAKLPANVRSGGINIAMVGHQQSVIGPACNIDDLLLRNCVHLPRSVSNPPLPSDANLAVLRLATSEEQGFRRVEEH